MSNQPKRPVMVLLTSHWISMLGAALVTLAGFCWIFALPIHIRGHVSNPYMGLLTFIALPLVFFAGLALIPIGIALAKRRVIGEFNAIPDRRTAWRKAAIFFGVMTVVNLVIASQVSFRAMEHMETVQFCGLTCHVMKPEFTAHTAPPHQEVSCATCHIVPGATGWVKAKMAGTHQLIGVIFNTYTRPIESAMENNRLVASADTCERCHAREKFVGPRLRIHTKFQDDEANTRTETVLMMQVGGGKQGGIHGAHLGPGVQISYGAADKKRHTIPWVEYRNTGTNTTRTYLASDADASGLAALPKFEMQCVDCHNRIGHSFDTPEGAVDRALAGGEIPLTLPLVRKTGVELVQAAYKSDADAEQAIPAGVASFYSSKYPDVAGQRAADVRAAGQALLAVYRRNVFPDLKVTWGTYPDNLGHVDFPGCFRCHDGAHAASGGASITQDCNTCHQALAMEETSPEILKTLGVPVP